MNGYLQLLGFKVRDVVTGFEGVAESVCFDLYGCVQVAVRPPRDPDPAKCKGEWFDFKRLTKTKDPQVMAAPSFAGLSPGDENGPAEKPDR